MMTNCTVGSSSPFPTQAKFPFDAKHQLKRVRRVVARRVNVIASSATRMEIPSDVQQKAVRFPFQLATVKTFEKVDQNEAGCIWYSAEENQVLVDDYLKSIIAIREAYWNKDLLDDSEHTYLGLEQHILPEQALIRRAAVEAHARRFLTRSCHAVVECNPAA